MQTFAKREGKNGPATVLLIPMVVNAFATDFVAFHRVLILRFPIALIVAWTPDPRFFNAKCSLLFKVTLLLSESASNSRVFLSWCMALDRNTSYPDKVCWDFLQNEEDPMSYVLLDSHKNSALSITPASLNARLSIYHCLFDTFQAVCITYYS